LEFLIFDLWRFVRSAFFFFLGLGRNELAPYLSPSILREIESDRGSLPQATVHPDSPPVLFHDPPDECQSQADPSGMGREKGFKNQAEILLRDSHPSVSDGYPHIIPVIKEG
jgi:hypothetical protein